MVRGLTEVIAAGLHNDYLLACVLAVLCLLLACLLPARLSPRGSEVAVVAAATGKKSLVAREGRQIFPFAASCSPRAKSLSLYRV